MALGWIERLFQGMWGILRLHWRVKAIEERLAKETHMNAGLLAEQQRQAKLDAEERKRIREEEKLEAGRARAERERQATELCDNVYFEHLAVFLRQPLPGSTAGPYCPTCWRPPDAGSLVLMHTTGKRYLEGRDEYDPTPVDKCGWICGVCKTSLRLPIY